MVDIPENKTKQQAGIRYIDTYLCVCVCVCVCETVGNFNVDIVM